MPPKASYADRVFTTEVVSYPEIVHIGENRDFSPVIAKAVELGGYDKDTQFTGINGGKELTVGFGHGTVLSVAGTVVDAVKQGVLKNFSFSTVSLNVLRCLKFKSLQYKDLNFKLEGLLNK